MFEMAVPSKAVMKDADTNNFYIFRMFQSNLHYNFV